MIESKRLMKSGAPHPTKLQDRRKSSSRAVVRDLQGGREATAERSHELVEMGDARTVSRWGLSVFQGKDARPQQACATGKKREGGSERWG